MRRVDGEGLAMLARVDDEALRLFTGEVDVCAPGARARDARHIVGSDGDDSSEDDDRRTGATLHQHR